MKTNFIKDKNVVFAFNMLEKSQNLKALTLDWAFVLNFVHSFLDLFYLFLSRLLTAQSLCTLSTKKYEKKIAVLYLFNVYLPCSAF